MPQADLYVSADQTVDAEALIAIEQIIQDFDSSAGACKGRVHPVDVFHHSHILLCLSMLPKAHRDAAYAEALGQKLAECLSGYGTASSVVNVRIAFDLVHYTALNIE